MMQRFRKRFQELFFIISMAVLGLLVGTAISSYHTICVRSWHGFFLRPWIGLLVGFCSSLTHLLMLWLIDWLSKGAYRKRPILHGLQFTLIIYLYLLGAEFVFFQNRLSEASHRYWILSLSFLSFIVSTLFFIYYRLIEVIYTQFSILEKLHFGIIESLITVLEVKEPSKKGHSKRVAEGCQHLAKSLNLPPDQRNKLRRAAMMHDLGKIGIDDRILQKEGTLSEDELTAVRLHPIIAQKILAPLNVLAEETAIIKASHFYLNLVNMREKENEGIHSSLESSVQSIFAYSAAAEGLEDLPIEARILSVIDFYDTLTHARPNKKVLSSQEGLDEIESGVGTRFDRRVVDALNKLIKSNKWPGDDKNSDNSDSSSSSEDEILKEVRKTAKKLNMLNNFYHYMGVGRHNRLRALFLSLFSGTLLGIILGATLYASTSNPIWVRLFIYQGLVSGSFAWIIGYTLESKLARSYPDSFLSGPGGAFAAFSLSAIPSSLICLVYYLSPQWPVEFHFDLLSLLFVICNCTIAGIIGALYRYLQDSSFRLLEDQVMLQKAYFDLICSLSFALETLDPYTRGHSEKVSVMSRALGEKLGFVDDKLEELEKAALFHDIGKLAISPSIIKKTSRLTDDEYNIIRTHPSIGAEILEPVKYFSELSPFVKAHHENYDGKGYPERKEKEGIPLIARIISIADSYDAMVSDRSYRKGLSKETAVGELRKCAGTQFDPHLVELFIETLD
ncbi:MAG: HD-GYP domain-containing protein [Vulcanimicrobiota bacterium]